MQQACEAAGYSVSSVRQGTEMTAGVHLLSPFNLLEDLAPEIVPLMFR